MDKHLESFEIRVVRREAANRVKKICPITWQAFIEKCGTFRRRFINWKESRWYSWISNERARNSINSLLRYYSSHLHIHIYSLSFALIPNNFLLRTVRTFSRVRRNLFEEETNPRRFAYIIAGNRWLREEHSASGTVRVKPFFGRSITRNSPPAFERGNKTSLARPIVLLAMPLYIYIHTHVHVYIVHTYVHTGSINVRDNGTKVYHYLSYAAWSNLLPSRIEE